MPSSDDGVRFLATSRNRVSLLDALDDGPLQPAELARRLSLSRSAIQRNLRELTDRNWVRRTDGGYVTTLGGRLVLADYEELVGTVRLVSEYGHCLEPLSDAGLALSPSVLESASVTTATRTNPHAPLRHYVERIRETDVERFRGITPVVSPLFNEAHASLTAGGGDHELVLDADALAASRTEYGPELDAGVDADGLTIYVHPDSLSFGLSIVDGRVFLGAFDEGQFVACFEWNEAGIETRALDAYESYRDGARELDAAEL